MDRSAHEATHDEASVSNTAGGNLVSVKLIVSPLVMGDFSGSTVATLVDSIRECRPTDAAFVEDGSVFVDQSPDGFEQSHLPSSSRLLSIAVRSDRVGTPVTPESVLALTWGLAPGLALGVGLPPCDRVRCRRRRPNSTDRRSRLPCVRSIGIVRSTVGIVRADRRLCARFLFGSLSIGSHLDRVRCPM